MDSGRRLGLWFGGLFCLWAFVATPIVVADPEFSLPDGGAGDLTAIHEEPGELPTGDDTHDIPDPEFDVLVPYYQKITNGLIHPANGIPGPDVAQEDWFTLDVLGFNQWMKTPDFVEARRSFYSQLDFQSGSQRHDRPYHYLASWRSLFHPPIKKLTLPLDAYVSDFKPMNRDEVQSEYFTEDFQRRVDAVSGTELTYGNELQLLPNGPSFQEKLRLIREAKHSFFGVVMIYFCDDSTRQLMNEMIRRKKEGVDVRLMVEGVWASTVASKCVNIMKKAGIPIVKISDWYKPKSFISVMHHKIWIRDGEEAIIGGQNMHENSNLATGFNHRTRDTDMLIRRGPAVTDLFSEYVRLWRNYTNGWKRRTMDPYLPIIQTKLEAERLAGVRGAENYGRWLANPETRMNGVCRMLVQSSGATRQAIAPVLAEHLRVAKDHVFLTSPSVSYDTNAQSSQQWHNLLAGLVKKRAREGIKFDLLSNGIEGGSGEFGYVMQRLGQTFPVRIFPILRRLMDALESNQDRKGARDRRVELMDMARTAPTIRTWQYFEFLHAKTWFFDRVVSSVGSFNFDHYSAEKSHESTGICMDKALSNQVERQFTSDMVNSVPVVSANE